MCVLAPWIPMVHRQSVVGQLPCVPPDTLLSLEQQDKTGIEALVSLPR